MQVHEIPGKVSVNWNSEVKAIVDTWKDYGVSLEEFSDAVLNKGVGYGKANGVKAWIVDSSQAKGNFREQIQQFIGSDVFPRFAEIGVKYFVTISSQVSALTNLTVASYSSKTGPHGLELIEVNNVNDAIEWLRVNA